MSNQKWNKRTQHKVAELRLTIQARCLPRRRLLGSLKSPTASRSDPFHLQKNKAKTTNAMYMYDLQTKAHTLINRKLQAFYNSAEVSPSPDASKLVSLLNVSVWIVS